MNPLSALVRAVRVPRKRLVVRALRRAARAAVAPPSGPVDLHRHLQATYRWLRCAHDATPDDGVSALYSLVQGWTASYPETSGYWIPTLLAYSDATQDTTARARAHRIARWETEVQLPSGAVRSGWLDRTPAPAVFNTGQVLFGWAAAHRDAPDPAYADAARRAAEWLLSVQDDDGAWRRDLSEVTDSDVQTYNVRAAWGLAVAGRVFDQPAWIDAARRNARWTLTRQDASGWFQDAAFHRGEDPVLHTIAYVQEGLLGLGALLDEPAFVEACVRSVRPLVTHLERGEGLVGRYGPDWSRRARWRCLTGEAQVAIVLLRLARRDPDFAPWRRHAQHLLEDVARTQDLSSRHVPSRGGVAGSAPIWAPYCNLSYPNHAAKFFVDGLLLLLHDHDPQARFA